MFFIGFHSIVKVYTVGFTPECTTLETVETMRAFLVAIPTLHSCDIALFYGQYIQQTVDSKVGRQLVKISTSRDFTLFSTLWACYDITTATRSLNPLQAMKTETV